MTALDEINQLLEGSEDHIVKCSICHRIFETGSRDWFRHWNEGTCHGINFEALNPVIK